MVPYIESAYIAKGNQNLIKAYTDSGVDSKLKQSNETQNNASFFFSVFFYITNILKIVKTYIHTAS